MFAFVHGDDDKSHRSEVNYSGRMEREGETIEMVFSVELTSFSTKLSALCPLLIAQSRRNGNTELHAAMMMTKIIFVSWSGITISRSCVI